MDWGEEGEGSAWRKLFYDLQVLLFAQKYNLISSTVMSMFLDFCMD